MGNCLPCVGGAPSAPLSAPQPPFKMTFAVAPVGGFAASYEKSPDKNFAFLIPGDEELFVGGGALNGAVGKVLFETANQGDHIQFKKDPNGKYVTTKEGEKDVPVFAKDKCPYRKTMEALFKRSHKQKNTMVIATPAEIGNLPLQFSAGRTYSACDHPFGSVFLHVFKDGYCPHGNKKNMAVLYCVGALGINAKAPGEGVPNPERAKYIQNDVKDFLYELNQTGDSAVTLILEYNRQAKGKNLPIIEKVRMPVVSGGIFMHPAVTPKEAALALIWGAHNGLAKGASRNETVSVELMPGGAMEDAYKAYEGKQKPESWKTVACKSKDGKDTFDVFAKIRLAMP